MDIKLRWLQTKRFGGDRKFRISIRIRRELMLKCGGGGRGFESTRRGFASPWLFAGSQRGTDAKMAVGTHFPNPVFLPPRLARAWPRVARWRFFVGNF